MLTNTDKNAPENPPFFYCKNCNFKCSKKRDYERHVMTRKHLKFGKIITNTDINTDTKVDKYFECICGKKYNHRQSLFIHKKKCIYEPIIDEKNVEKESNNLFDKNIIIQLIKQNQEFQSILIEQNQKNQELMMELVKNQGNITTNSHNTTNNNKFNMNIFLNEKCKDAMNIMDFVSSLKISFEDLENVGEVGYVKGITNIISNGLNKLDVHKRPIHCSDVKREVFYVKDNNVWEKETEEKKKITRAIKHISYNTARKVTPWTELPENAGVYDYYNKLNDKYSKISSQANGGDQDEVAKIIKNIAGKVTIDKRIY
jgi:hypothetical protein